MIVTGTITATNPAPANPRLKTCGIGLMRLISLWGTNASTDDVPRMNIAAMIGAAMSVALPIVRSGFLHSPASTATYSNPLSAPSAILPSRLRLSAVSGGIDAAKG